MTMKTSGTDSPIFDLCRAGHSTQAHQLGASSYDGIALHTCNCNDLVSLEVVRDKLDTCLESVPAKAWKWANLQVGGVTINLDIIIAVSNTAIAKLAADCRDGREHFSSPKQQGVTYERSRILVPWRMVLLFQRSCDQRHVRGFQRHSSALFYGE